jgi:hypothetical protein
MRARGRRRERCLSSPTFDGATPGGNPVNSKQGEDVIIVPAISDAEAKEKFPAGWKAPKPYMRIVPQPP